MWPRVPVSVGRRLTTLVVVDALTLLALLAVAVLALSRGSADLGYMRRYVLPPVEALPKAIDDAARLEVALRSDPEGSARTVRVQDLIGEIDRFASQYRSDWVVLDNPAEDAARFRRILQDAHRTGLMAQERTALDALFANLTHLKQPGASRDELVTNAAAARRALRSLLDVNAQYVVVTQEAINGRAHTARDWLILIGVANLIGATLLGLAVHRAIAPRIRRVVKQVDRFREVGVYDQLTDSGRDEIATLAHAVDVGIRTIAARDREREQFLAVAAHELKTPVTAIAGYAQAALENPSDMAMRDRAVSIIHRNAGRLGRLIEDLLLAASARSGKLRFDPKPIDLASLTRRSVQEVEALVPNHPFELHTPTTAYLLADEDLLIHAEWSLLSYAAALSAPHAPIGVTVASLPGRVRLEVTLADGRLTESEISRALSPMDFVQYEENGGLRQTGLFLCREVAQVHGGSLRIGHSPEGKAAVTLELPA